MAFLCGPFSWKVLWAMKTDLVWASVSFPLYTNVCLQMTDETYSREITIWCNANFVFSNVKGLYRNGKYEAQPSCKQRPETGNTTREKHSTQYRYEVINEDCHRYKKPLYSDITTLHAQFLCRTFWYQISIAFQDQMVHKCYRNWHSQWNQSTA